MVDEWIKFANGIVLTLIKRNCMLQNQFLNGCGYIQSTAREHSLTNSVMASYMCQLRMLPHGRMALNTIVTAEYMLHHGYSGA